MKTLKALNIVKHYKSKTVVNGIDLAINCGEIVGLLGPNGAGKTTTFYMIVGLISPNKGKVFLNDKDITYAPMHQRARLGISYLPQEASVFRKLSVEDNIKAILEIKKSYSKNKLNQLTNQLLEEFHITHLRKNLGQSLSGGERRRLEIAKAVASKPDFILLDEPFAGVDPISVIDIKMIIKQLAAKGIGVLITDHNVRETLDICHRAYIVNHGQIICEGDANKIIQNEEVRSAYLGDEFIL